MRQLITFFLFVTGIAFGQELSKKQVYNAKKEVREGNKAYESGDYEKATAAYEKSLKENQTYYKGAYNLGNALFKQQKFKEAGDQYSLANKLAKTKQEKARTKELVGDAYIAQKDLENAEKAYKEALLKNPSDDVLRQKYIATKQAKQQQDQQNKDNENQDQKDDQNQENKDNKDQKNDDKGDKNQDQNKDKGDDQKDKDGENQDQEDEQKENEKEGDQKGNNSGDSKEGPQPQPSKLSQQQIEQLLENMSNEEQKTQKKVNAQKVKVNGKKNEKDW